MPDKEYKNVIQEVPKTQAEIQSNGANGIIRGQVYISEDTNAVMYRKISTDEIVRCTSQVTYGTVQGTATEGNDSRLLTIDQKTDLTDGGDSTIHMHDSRYYKKVEIDGMIHNSEGPTGSIQQADGAGGLNDTGIRATTSIGGPRLSLAGSGANIHFTSPNIAISRPLKLETTSEESWATASVGQVNEKIQSVEKNLEQVLTAGNDGDKIGITNLGSLDSGDLLLPKSGRWQVSSPVHIGNSPNVVGLGVNTTANGEYTQAGTRDAGSGYGMFPYYRRGTTQWYLIRQGWYWIVTDNLISPEWATSIAYGAGGLDTPEGYYIKYGSETGTNIYVTMEAGSSVVDSLVVEGSLFCDAVVKANDGFNVNGNLAITEDLIQYKDQASIQFNSDGSVSLPKCVLADISEPDDIVTLGKLESTVGKYALSVITSDYAITLTKDDKGKIWDLVTPEPVITITLDSTVELESWFDFTLTEGATKQINVVCGSQNQTISTIQSAFRLYKYGANSAKVVTYSPIVDAGSSSEGSVDYVNVSDGSGGWNASGLEVKTTNSRDIQFKGNDFKFSALSNGFDFEVNLDDNPIGTGNKFQVSYGSAQTQMLYLEAGLATLPMTTNATINTGGNKSLVTKEYGNEYWGLPLSRFASNSIMNQASVSNLPYRSSHGWGSYIIELCNQTGGLHFDVVVGLGAYGSSKATISVTKTGVLSVAYDDTGEMSAYANAWIIVEYTRDSIVRYGIWFNETNINVNSNMYIKLENYPYSAPDESDVYLSSDVTGIVQIPRANNMLLTQNKFHAPKGNTGTIGGGNYENGTTRTWNVTVAGAVVGDSVVLTHDTTFVDTLSSSGASITLKAFAHVSSSNTVTIKITVGGAAVYVGDHKHYVAVIK